MNKLLVISFAALIAAMGCATNPMHPAKVSPAGEPAPVVSTDSAPPKVGDVVGFAKERAPAQAGRTHWVEDSQAITVSPQGGRAEVVLSPRQILSYEETYRYTCNQYTWGYGTCEDYVCSGNGGGKSELWNAYYSAPAAQKVNALDRALLGIGQSSAQKLHKSGIFSSKARSWQEFRERMNKALRAGVITEQQYREVFGTYGRQNRENLGYGGQDCRTEYYSCQVYGLFPVTNGCESTRISEKVINVMNKTVQVNVNRPQLQSFETETLTVRSGPTFDSIEVLRTDKTDYQVNKVQNGDGAILNLDGVGRYQIPLPQSAFQDIRFNDSRGQNMNAVISVDPKYMGEGQDRLMLTLQVTHCKPGGFFSVGDCAGRDEEGKVKMAPAYHEIKQGTSSFALPTVPAGNRVWVTYALHRENSKWYNNSPLEFRPERLKELKK